MSALPLPSPNGDSIVKIPPREWKELCDRLSRSHEGWLASLTTVKRGKKAEREASNLPLTGLVYETRTRSFQISLDEFTHSVKHPAHVWLRIGADGADKGLDIQSADATHTLLEFRSAKPTEMVDGLAPPLPGA